MKRRYPFTPVITIGLQIIAGLLCLAIIYMSINFFVNAVHSWKGGVGQFGQPLPPVTKFSERFNSLFPGFVFLLAAFGIPGLVWAIADGLNSLREIEFNTRAAAPPSAYVKPAGPETKAGGNNIAE